MGSVLLDSGQRCYSLCGCLPWGRRAWTFQEPLLSQRCIYITNNQAYFECNSIQCWESLDESRYWVHQTLRDEALLNKAPEIPTFGTGVLRSPFIPQFNLYDSRLEKYSTLVPLNKHRSLTKQSDAIHAFSGVLQALGQKEYTEGFSWALPVADLNWALSWETRAPGSLGRQKRFPAWSWAS